jgi:hypothetical protein
MRQVDIAIVGAGMAGLACAQKLQQTGRQVIVVEKSRGLGGRLATRRLAATHADHGVCYIQPQGVAFTQFIEELHDRAVVHPWTDRIHTFDAAGQLHAPSQWATCYVAPQGATAIAKYLAQGVEIIREQQVVALTPLENRWQLQSADTTLQLMANHVIMAIPAPQAVAIVEKIAGFDRACLAQLRARQFAPVITAIAAYPAELQPQAQQLSWQGIQAYDHAELAWIGLDSSKQIAPVQPTIVVQSSAAFAAQRFDAADLMTIGQRLLDRAATLADWIAQPEVLQVHRWRYALAQNPLSEPFLQAKAHAPLWFCGDWCGGNRVEAAYLSGIAIAQQVLANL